MGRMRWRTWVVVMAVGLGIVATLPARAAGPPGNTAAAPQKELDEAKQLQAEVEQLFVQGRYAEALPLEERVLSLREKALGAEHPDVGAALNDLGVLYLEKGDFGRAEPLHQRALSIYEKAFGPEHPAVALSLNNLAGLYHQKGDNSRVEALYQRALSIYEKAFGSEHAAVATCVDNLAELYQAQGDFERAEPLRKRALSMREKTLGPEHPDVALSLNNLAALYAAQGRRAEAVNACRRGADLQDRNAAAVLATGSEEQKRLYVAKLAHHTSTALSLHVQHASAEPAAARLALTVLLRRKGRVLDVMADSLAALRRTLAPGDQALLDQLASVYGQLATLVARARSGASLAQYRASLVSLEQERQKLEAELSQRSAAFRAQQSLVTLARVDRVGARRARALLSSSHPRPRRARRRLLFGRQHRRHDGGAPRALPRRQREVR
jgi:tetratricopeptide (TPR) repeat protein